MTALLRTLAEREKSDACLTKAPQQFPPLESVTRPTVPTEQAAYYLNRKPQTLRAWACLETYPDELKPLRVHGHLAWPVRGLKRLLGVSQ